MRKDDATNIMNNSNLIDKMGALYIFLFIYKMCNTTYYKKAEI